MELLTRNAQWTHSHGLHLFQPGIKKLHFPVELLVYKINLLEYTLQFFSRVQLRFSNQTPVILHHNCEAFLYLYALELNIKMEVNVLNRQQLSELSDIGSFLHYTGLWNKCCLREPVYFYNSSQCQCASSTLHLGISLSTSLQYWAQATKSCFWLPQALEWAHMDALLWTGAVAWVPLNQIIRGLIGSTQSSNVGRSSTKVDMYQDL